DCRRAIHAGREPSATAALSPSPPFRRLPSADEPGVFRRSGAGLLRRFFRAERVLGWRRCRTGAEASAPCADQRRVFRERRSALALGAALAMERDGKTMRFVANLLDQVQDGRVAVEHERLIFLPVDVEDFLLFGDGGERLIDDLQRFKSLGGGVKLADAA